MSMARTDWRSLGVACAGAFVAALSTSVVAISVPVIARDLEVSQAEASWVLTAYLVTASCLLALSGRAADVAGRKRIYLTGFVFFVAGSAMCAGAPTFFALVGARILQGVGAAMLMAVGPAIVTRAVAPEKRARGLGIQLAATYLGLTIGPSVGGALASAVSWHAVFTVVAIAGAAGGAIALIVLERDTPRDEPVSVTQLDLSGAGLLAVGLGALLVALRRGGEAGWTSAPFVAIAALAVVALIGFVRHERVHPSPLLPPSLLSSAPFAFGILGATLLYVVTFMLAFALPFHLQRALHLEPRAAGIVMTAQPAMMAITAPASGWIADRFGARLPSTAGMVLIAGGLLLVAAAPTSVVALGVVGVGAGLYVAPNNSVIMGAAPRDRQATAAAMAATARNVGMTCGVALAASLERSIGFGHTLHAASALAVLGAVLALAR
jgi:EmrB/QacA subfamily drug resistance transporter